jgi:short-subunit dehydrogenase
MAQSISFGAGVRSIVTGASSGIGAAIATELAQRGARLVLSGRDLVALDAVATRCAEAGAELETVVGDLTAGAVQQELVDRAVASFGGIDLLVNNAGISMNARFAELADEVLREIFEVNFFAAAALTRLALPYLISARGRILVISSVTGLVGTPTRSAYAASKHALHGLFNALRIELSGTGATVTIVCPGFVRTEVRRRALRGDGSPQGNDDAEGRRMMTPELVAHRALAAAARRRRRLLLGAETHVAHLGSILVPRALDALLAKAGR